MFGSKGMDDSDGMYDEARMAKLKELRRLMVELELDGMDGALDLQKLEDALSEAEDAAEGSSSSMASMESEEEEGEEEEEEDPLAVARRKFFKPERKTERSPGTAVMIAMGGSAPKKPLFPSKKMEKGKA